MLTDRYELTMVDAVLASGVAGRRAVFEVFARELPPGRRYGVFAGLGRLLESLEGFRFDAEDLGFLEAERIVSAPTLAWLSAYRFGGSICAYAEGECYFPDSPVLSVEAGFAEGLVLETYILSVLNFDSAVASAASRVHGVAGGRPLIEMGSRRIHEQAAVAAARAAVVGGFDSTSNLEAGRRFGLATAGTASHAFTLAHRSEAEAFDSQICTLGASTTLLVDTYDLEQGVRNAVEAARRAGAAGPGAVRVDSGDLLVEVPRVRALLDSLGAERTRIVVSSDLDEFVVEQLAKIPVDAFGVGTRVVTGSGAPTAGFVYKLVAVGDEGGALVPVAKRAAQKSSLGGRKHAARVLDGAGSACAELVLVEGGGRHGPTTPVGARPEADGRVLRPLCSTVVESGRVVAPTDVARAAERRRASLAELGPLALEVSAGSALLPVEFRDVGGG